MSMEARICKQARVGDRNPGPEAAAHRSASPKPFMGRRGGHEHCLRLTARAEFFFPSWTQAPGILPGSRAAPMVA
jgi:hypothetical protein